MTNCDINLSLWKPSYKEDALGARIPKVSVYLKCQSPFIIMVLTYRKRGLKHHGIGLATTLDIWLALYWFNLSIRSDDLFF